MSLKATLLKIGIGCNITTIYSPSAGILLISSAAGNDELVGVKTVQTMINNTIINPNTNFNANGLNTNIPNNPVIINGSSPIGAGQSLITTSSTTASWSHVQIINKSTIITIGNVPGTIVTIPTSNNLAYMIIIDIFGRDTETQTNIAGYKMHSAYHNINGVLSSITGDDALEKFVGCSNTITTKWSVTSTIIDNNIAIIVTGGSSDTIRWSCAYTLTSG